jgi:hypothetical protein
MLASLHVWKTFLAKGLKEFGSPYYLGTVPVAGRPESCHVVVGTYDVFEVRLIFAPDNGELIAMEVYSSNAIDPCELFFDDYRDVGDGRRIPHQIDVRVGMDSFALLEVEKIDLAATATADEANGNDERNDEDADDKEAANEVEAENKS